MPNRYNINSPEVQQLLSGVMRCSPQTYYHVSPVTGLNEICAIRSTLLRELRIYSKIASALFKEANILITSFRNPVEAASPAVEQEPPSEDPLGPSEEELEAEAERLANAKRYSLTTSESRTTGAISFGV